MFLNFEYKSIGGARCSPGGGGDDCGGVCAGFWFAGQGGSGRRNEIHSFLAIIPRQLLGCSGGGVKVTLFAYF